MGSRPVLVRDVMTTRYTAFRPDMDIEEAIAAILRSNLMGAPVVDGGRLVGVLSEKDVFRVVANQVFGFGNEHGGRVSDFMTAANLVSISPDVDLASITSKFLSHIYRGLPVVLHVGPERGMLMASSLIGWLLVAAVSLLGLTVALWSNGIGPSIRV